MSKRSDQRRIKAYLVGERSAAAAVDADIEAAFSVWKHRFGYEADDIRSDVRYKLLLSLRRDDFKFDSSLRTYISRIVSHTCIDYLRASRRRDHTDIDEISIASSVLTAEQQLERSQLSRINFRVIRMISVECRQLWRLYLKHGLSYRQIGELWEKTEANVRRRMWACRKTAREIREKLLAEDKRMADSLAGKGKDTQD